MVFEYLTLFMIVLLHEYGHALACKQVGGTANRIMLWPLGGVAYVSPPPRAGANLWSIAAGPLVNVALVPVFLILGFISRSLGIPQSIPDAHSLLRSVAMINVGLLIFNLLPIYPLDGGQIVRSLLWFIFGRARSLTISAVLGLLGVVGLIFLAIKLGSTWFVIMSVFILINCWAGLKHSRVLSQIAKLPRRDGFACPSCHSAPSIGPLWKCNACESLFDTFEHHAQCPTCGSQFAETSCMECGARHAITAWNEPTPVRPAAKIESAVTP
jgi:Zn-dependent protease